MTTHPRLRLFVSSLVFALLAIPAIASAQGATGGLPTKTGGLADSPNSFTIGYIGKYFHGETFEDEFSTPGQFYGGIDFGYHRRIKKMDKAELGVVGGLQLCFHEETAVVVLGGVVYTRELTTTVKFFVEAEAGVWHESDNNFALRFDAGPEFHVGDCERMTVRPFAGIEPVFFGGGHETAFAFGANVRLLF
jgi:hypothetical protein